MKISRLCFVFFSLVLAGCSSSSTSLTYYVLHSPNAKVSKHNQPTQKVALQQLVLPDYLQQRSLTMLTGPATVYVSNQHVWAEPMDKSFVQALNGALLSDRNIEIIPPHHHAKQSSVAKLYVKIDDFIASSDGIVLLKGQFWLDGEGKSEKIQYFDFRRPMQGDGFEQAVVTMRQLVSDLATAISDEV